MKRDTHMTLRDRIHLAEGELHIPPPRERTTSYPCPIRREETENVERLSRSLDETGLDEVNDIINHNYYRDEQTPKILKEHLKFPGSKQNPEVVFKFVESPQDSVAMESEEEPKEVFDSSESAREKRIELNPALSWKQKESLIKQLKKTGTDFVDASPQSSPEKNPDSRGTPLSTPPRPQQAPSSTHSSPKTPSNPPTAPDVFQQLVYDPNTGAKFIIPYHRDAQGNLQPGLPYGVPAFYSTAPDMIPSGIVQTGRCSPLFVQPLPVLRGIPPPEPQEGYSVPPANPNHPLSEQVRREMENEGPMGPGIAYHMDYFNAFYQQFSPDRFPIPSPQRDPQPTAKRALNFENMDHDGPQEDMDNINQLPGFGLSPPMNVDENDIEMMMGYQEKTKSDPSPDSSPEKREGSSRQRNISTSSDKSRKEKDEPCGYCLATNNERIAYNHTKKTCPKLQKMEPCAICGASGENNHTQMYCPEKKPVYLDLKAKQPRPWWGFPPPVVAPRGQYRVGEEPAEWMCNPLAQFPVGIYRPREDDECSSDSGL